MANNPAQDMFNPSGMRSEFEKHQFGDINIGEVFRLTQNNNDPTFRKENEYKAMRISERVLESFTNDTVIYIKI
jgi:hypothetical protein|tara:strand:+ start:857 stop:1078 length:222 start_codon:yes stop_codon:yes gene_type:complete